MKLQYLLVADAAASGAFGKMDVLGLGVRVLRPGRLPSLTPLNILVGAEADPAELGEQSIKISVQAPSAKAAVVVDDTVVVAPRPAEEEGLPIEVRLHLAFPFITTEPGVYTFRVQIGRLRATYKVLVIGSESESGSIEFTPPGSAS